MNAEIYRSRREALRNAVDGGAILILGNNDAPKNYVDNAYPFRQDSHFLYYAGIAETGMAALIEPDGRDVLFGRPFDPDDLVWHGPRPHVGDHAAAAGFAENTDISDLKKEIDRLVEAGVRIHYLPPYRAERCFRLADLLDANPSKVGNGVSEEFVRAVCDQRLIKTPEEIAEIEDALGVTAEMYRVAMAAAQPGRKEHEVAGRMQAQALELGRQQAFPPIVSVRGEVLHNHSYDNTLADGDLMLMDSGAESPRFYASDITRTFPVNGSFSDRQRRIYEIVLAAQMAVIHAASPTHDNREMHRLAARTIAGGLTALGLMKGNPDDAVTAGAHALFFPHGIGHMMGLDVHDMEDLGDIVGYPEGEQRSTQFGLAFLRLARRLEAGHVITVEPGIYFIPALIDQWRSENRHPDFIDYDAVEAYKGFGGIRIEDDVLITDDGCRVLGPGIPKTVDEVEAACRQ
ncbi:MAG: aminopeptidase P family protein [Thermoanaerobaculales bacterium]|jgi:Xaa-Pro aminopeptidase|nr:aminopeptidase P family protein [Thermoanaerobaculales bacterium]